MSLNSLGVVFGGPLNTPGRPGVLSKRAQCACLLNSHIALFCHSNVLPVVVRQNLKIFFFVLLSSMSGNCWEQGGGIMEYWQW